MAKQTTRTKGTQQLGDRILVFWRRPEEWAESILAWISATGQNGSIMTFFELTEGDLVQKQGEERREKADWTFVIAHTIPPSQTFAGCRLHYSGWRWPPWNGKAKPVCLRVQKAMTAWLESSLPECRRKDKLYFYCNLNRTRVMVTHFAWCQEIQGE